MADKYLTSVQDILAGFECNTRGDGNPYDGERHDALRYYRGVRSYDVISHDDEKGLLLFVTDYHMLLVVCREEKLAELCDAASAEDARYFFENRGGRIVFRCDSKEKLTRRILDLDWSWDEESVCEESESDSCTEEETEEEIEIILPEDEQDCFEDGYSDDLQLDGEPEFDIAKADYLDSLNERIAAEDEAAKVAETAEPGSEAFRISADLSAFD